MGGLACLDEFQKLSPDQKKKVIHDDRLFREHTWGGLPSKGTRFKHDNRMTKQDRDLRMHLIKKANPAKDARLWNLPGGHAAWYNKSQGDGFEYYNAATKEDWKGFKGKPWCCTRSACQYFPNLPAARRCRGCGY